MITLTDKQVQNLKMCSDISAGAIIKSIISGVEHSSATQLFIGDEAEPFTKADKMLSMIMMQDQVNCVVDEGNWFNKERKWYRAAWMEAAEMLDHYGYKWWKKQDPDMAQVHMELVDIWHFALSNWIEAHYRKNNSGVPLEASFSATELQQMVGLLEHNSPNPFESYLETFVVRCLNEKFIAIEYLSPLFSSSGLDFDTLYKMYTGKNALNRFRQQNGYKDGTYRKMWDGQEDNEHLVQILETLDDNSPDFYRSIMVSLEMRYNATN